MRIEIPNKLLGAAALGGACFAAGMGVAAEFPEEDGALVYSGVLTDDAGHPRATTESITVTLYDAASGGQSLCAASQAAVDLSDTQGRFALPLPGLCTNAIAEAGDAWAQIKVGTTTLPRQKLGTVPFALVARDAQTAAAVEVNGVSNSAIQDGAVSAAKLDPAIVADVADHGARLTALESSSDEGPSYLVATLAAQNPPANVSTILQFAATTANSTTPADMDLINERFVASLPGTYALTLQVAANEWQGTKPLIAVSCGSALGHYSAAGGLGLNNGGAARGTWFFVLEAGDTCQARIVMSDMTTPVTLDVDPFRSFFEVMRIGN